MSICATEAQPSMYIHTEHMTPGPGPPKGLFLPPAAPS